MFQFQLRNDEKFIAFYRQTEFMLMKPLAAVFVLIYLPWYFLLRYGLVYQFRWVLFLWTLGVLLYAVYRYLVWLLNVNLVTSQRVISIQHSGLFRKSVLEAPVDRISSVDFSSTGAWSAMLKFGDVAIHSMHVADPLIFHRVSHPAEIKDLLWRLSSRARPRT